MRKMENTEKPINSILRIKNILECVVSGQERFTDISKRLNLSLSTTHRLIKSLQITGFVTQDPLNRHYFLGPLISKLASNINASHLGLIVCAHRDMEELWRLTGETVSLATRIGMQTVQLEELPSHHDLKITTGRIFAAPVYAGAAGKVLLSQLDGKDLKTIIKKVELVRFAPNTIIDKEKLMEEVEKVKNYGYSISYSEVRRGASSISVPIRNYFCEIALTVYGPDSRFSPEETDVIEAIKRSSIRISNKVRDLTEIK